MSYSMYTKRNFRGILHVTLAGMFLGFIYPVLADGFTAWLPFVNGMAIGTIGGFLVGFFELQMFDPHNRKLSFLVIVSIKTILYSTVIIMLTITIMGINESLYYERGFVEHITGPQFQKFLFEDDFIVIVIYSLTFIGGIIFLIQLSRKMGQGVLVNMISGKYHKPKEEEIIFMFLDLKSSTAIAEKLGEIRYYELLNTFFHDIAKCIVYTHGEIYRYVGDEVVVTWSLKKGLHNANSIRTFFYIQNEINRLKEVYLKNYDLVPGFRAAFHYGKVIRGEIGDVKSQLVFHGGPLYTTAIVEKKCSEMDLDILVTADLIQRISLPVIYEMKQVGKLEMDREIDLYTIQEMELESG